MPGKFLPGFIAEFEARGQTVRFFITSITDGIQNSQANFRFYEQEELTLIEQYFPRGGVYVDVGANVGNHAVYVGKFLAPAKVIVFEPIPMSIDTLRVNLLLNGVPADTTHLGIGLSDGTGGTQMAIQPGNLGTARIIRDSKGTIRLVPGDSLLADKKVDFIKIDVEGHEMQVLRGLSKTIDVNRPAMFIEVDNGNNEAFMAWVEAHNYAIERSIQRYAANKNFLVRSKTAAHAT